MQDPIPSHIFEPDHGAKTQDAASSQLIHELANLLDGCLRNISLVMADLKQATQAPSGRSLDEQSMLPRLQTAQQAMNQMISLVERSRDQPQLNPSQLHDQPRTLGQVIELASQLLTPSAAAAGIEMTLDISDALRRLPAGPVYPVIANALLNSVEAINARPADHAWPGPSSSPRGVVRIEGAVADHQVQISIRDTGPGLAPSVTDEAGRFIFGRSTKPTGQGVGLVLCRDIARSLGGSLELANLPTGGAGLTLQYPVDHANNAQG